MADNDVVVRTGKTLRVGDVNWIIVEPVEIPLACPDFVLDTRHFNGVIQIAMASTRVEADVREAVVCVRLRMDLNSAQLLHNTLGSLITNSLKPADQSKAN